MRVVLAVAVLTFAALSFLRAAAPPEPAGAQAQQEVVTAEPGWLPGSD